MIELINVKKAYNDHTIFDNLNGIIEDKEMVAIVGKSGCGKTSLLNLLGLIDQSYDGTIRITGTDLKKLNEKKRLAFIRNHINYLFQNFALIDDKSVEENLMLALYYTKMDKSKKKAAILDVLKELSMDSCLHKKIYHLSGGEQQRIALARAMLKPGEIILADEPTGNLDKENRDIVVQNLIKLNQQGKTVIIVTHDEFVSSKCQKVIKL